MDAAFLVYGSERASLKWKTKYFIKQCSFGKYEIKLQALLPSIMTPKSHSMSEMNYTYALGILHISLSWKVT